MCLRISCKYLAMSSFRNVESDENRPYLKTKQCYLEAGGGGHTVQAHHASHKASNGRHLLPGPLQMALGTKLTSNLRLAVSSALAVGG